MRQTLISEEFREGMRFLQLIDPDAESFTFQIFPEGEAKGDRDLTPDILIGSFEGHMDNLSLYNEAGCGVFVTINETDGRGRKTENIKRVRAVWQDDDNGWKGKFELEPSIVVQTSEGKFQRYWLVDGPMTFMSFGGIMARIVEDFGGDAGAKDLARVLRLPGFWHRKGEPQLVEIISAPGKTVH